ncbi:MAG: hypothetical protein RQ875_02080 [Vicingaceae bacterium]|nr:hypothetical protein [Vicingaceae bacterium]
MIEKIKHNNIDFTKYDRCIATAFNHRIYAESWYLNLITNQSWDCLVLDDYKAVMPLPIKKKLGIKYIVMPSFCQQLGVFYTKKISPEQFAFFEKKLHHHLVRSYHFNEENTTMFQPKGELRNNYLLNCNNEYLDLKQAYQKDRKNDLKKYELSSCELKKELDFLTIYKLIQENYKDIITQNEINVLKKIVQFVDKNHKVMQVKVLCSGNCIATNIFLISKNRTINLCTLRDKSFKKFNTTTVMLDAIIKQNRNQILDFEGSMIEGVAAFFESFGAIKHYYTSYNNC